MNANVETFDQTTEVVPLTNWKNPPKLSNLKQDLMDARQSHDAQKLKIAGWLDNLNVTGKAQVVVVKGNSSVVPKLIRKQAEWRYAALSEPFLSTTDVFKVKPVTWEDREGSQQNQLVLNNQFNTQVDKTRLIDEYVRCAVDEGTVIVKVGWEFHEEEYLEKVPVVEYQVNPAMAEMHEQIAQIKAESPSQYETDVPEEMKQAHDLTIEQGQPIEPVILGYREEKKLRTVKNVPTAEICDYRNVIVDPTCLGDISKASFVIYHFESSMSELKRSKKYKNLDKVRVSANSVLSEPDHAASDAQNNFSFTDKPRMKVVVFEYWGFWDIDDTGVVKSFVTSWIGDTLVRMEESPFPDGELPFIFVQYLPVRKSIYGEPDGALLEDNQKISGAVTRGMLDVMGKSANGQTGMRKDMLDATNRRKFDKGMDYEFNANVDVRQGVHMHTYPNIPDSAQFMLQLQNMEAESLTGVKSFSGGISGAGLGDVAVGVRGALDAASKRELGILRRLSAGIVAIGRKFLSMNSQFLSDVEVIRITNEEFVKVRRDDLAGKFDLTLTISTAEEDNKKAEEMAFMLQTMGNNMDPGMSKMILSDIARLRKMPDLAHKIEAYEPQPDPMDQKMKELQVALLEAQIAVEQSKAQLNMANAQLGGTKIGTEQAKAAHLVSDTDQKNLDFVEQESGVKQERELQKSGEQARANQLLKIQEHNLSQIDQANNKDTKK